MHVYPGSSCLQGILRVVAYTVCVCCAIDCESYCVVRLRLDRSAISIGFLSYTAAEHRMAGLIGAIGVWCIQMAASDPPTSLTTCR